MTPNPDSSAKNYADEHQKDVANKNEAKKKTRCCHKDMPGISIKESTMNPICKCFSKPAFLPKATTDGIISWPLANGLAVIFSPGLAFLAKGLVADRVIRDVSADQYGVLAASGFGLTLGAFIGLIQAFGLTRTQSVWLWRMTWLAVSYLSVQLIELWLQIEIHNVISYFGNGTLHACLGLGIVAGVSPGLDSVPSMLALATVHGALCAFMIFLTGHIFRFFPQTGCEPPKFRYLYLFVLGSIAGSAMITAYGNVERCLNLSYGFPIYLTPVVVSIAVANWIPWALLHASSDTSITKRKEPAVPAISGP